MLTLSHCFMPTKYLITEISILCSICIHVPLCASRLPGILTDFCVPNNEFHRHGTRNTNELYVSFAWLDIRNLLQWLMAQIHGIRSQRLLTNPHLSAPSNTGLETILWVWNVAMRILKFRFFWLLSYVALYFHSWWLRFLFQVNFSYLAHFVSEHFYYPPLCHS